VVQTSLPEAFLQTKTGSRAESILRSCVHCGFCNATCPTYQLLGDELDGPRGRIYLIKEMLEQETVSPVAVTHLDRCLTCRACETTCPSGVAYGELLEIGRNYSEVRYSRRWFDRFVRGWLARVVPDPQTFKRWSVLGSVVKPFLSRRLQRQLPDRSGRHKRSATVLRTRPVGKILLLDGCVQRVSTPSVNDTLEELLTGRGIEVIRLADEGCCGSLALHLGREEEATLAMSANLDAIVPILDEIDTIVSTASGCGVTLKDYARLLSEDSDRAALATAFAAKVQDVGEYLCSLGGEWNRRQVFERVALHLPCTLQHGQRRAEFPAMLLEQAGYELVKVQEPHLCCGSAGTYAILQPELAEQLGERKVAALSVDEPQVIATANVGCQVHLSGAASVPVVHWIELLAGGSENDVQAA